MPDPTVDATVLVAQGSAAITWEVAAILSDGLSGLGLKTRLAEPETVAAGVPIIVFGRGATAPPSMSEAEARRAIVLLLAGPWTHAFNAAVHLAAVAAGCFAVSPGTIAALGAQGIRAERFVLGYTDRWDTGGIANRSKPVDIVCAGEMDRFARRALARVAPELAVMRSHIDLGHSESPSMPASFELSTLLAEARLTLSLNSWGDMTLDWPTTVRAMCNGSVVIAEGAAGYGELVPGEHLLMTRTESIGPVIRAAVADPQAVASMAATAYEFCRTELPMAVSLERLAASIERSRARVRMPRRRGRPPAASSERRVDADSQRLKFKVVPPGQQDMDPDVEVDVICVEHRGAGPVSLTRESLAGHQVRINLHVGTVGTAEHPRGLLPGQVARPIGTSAAEVRNDLVRRTSAPLVMFIDSGDEVLTGALSGLAAALRGSTQSDICMPLLALGTDDLVDPRIPDSSQNTADRAAPQRGYVVRRAYLDRMGPFVDGDAVGVDHAFWRRAAVLGGRVALLPQVSVRLWQESQVD
jgi:hypothetical protein